MKKVAILGCGPAGLLAAHAVERAGHEPVIISKPAKSEMPGAQYVHEAIPGITDDLPDGAVTFNKRGTKQGYAAKVYGHPGATCSWDQFPEGERPAWNMQKLYDKLWEKYHSSIEPYTLTRDYMEVIPDSFPLVISSIPLKPMCLFPDVHVFGERQVYIRTTSTWNPEIQPSNLIIYNGDPSIAWYRCSLLWGHISYEFGHEVGHARIGVKPLFTSCTCHRRIIRIGRFGQWKKGVLITDAFKEAQRALQSL